MCRRCSTQAEAKGVGALEVITSGYAETGPVGARRQAALSAWAERTGIAVGGPNCLGLMHAPSGMVALPTGFPEMTPGPVGVVLQSGMMAPTVLVPLLARGMGISFAVTTGNEADVEAADYIRYLAEDEQTRVIGVFAEQIKTPAKFIEACTIAAEQRKPIVMLKIGHSEAARRAALAHTGSLVGSDDVIDAVLRKLGVSRVDSVDELLEQLAVFHSSRLPQGSGVATVIVSGGAAGLLSDLAPRCGVNFPPLPEATAAALREVVPEYGNVGNPLDVTGQAVFQTEILARSLDLLAEAPGIDVVVYGRGFPSRLDGASPVGKILADAIARHPDTVFLAMALVGGHFYPSAEPRCATSRADREPGRYAISAGLRERAEGHCGTDSLRRFSPHARLSSVHVAGHRVRRLVQRFSPNTASRGRGRTLRAPSLTLSLPRARLDTRRAESRLANAAAQDRGGRGATESRRCLRSQARLRATVRARHPEYPRRARPGDGHGRRRDDPGHEARYAVWARRGGRSGRNLC